MCVLKINCFLVFLALKRKKNNDLQLLHMHVTFFIKIQQNIDNLCIKYLFIVHYKWCLIHFLSNQHVVIDCYSCVYNKTCPPFTSPSPWPSFRSDAPCTFHCGTCKWIGKIPLASSPLVWFLRGNQLRLIETMSKSDSHYSQQTSQFCCFGIDFSRSHIYVFHYYLKLETYHQNSKIFQFYI